MARSSGQPKKLRFPKGLVTEAPLMDSPDYIFEESDNIQVNEKGEAHVRLGLKPEEGYALSPTIPNFSAAFEYAQFNWKGVAKIADLNFLVQQVGNILYFYDTLYTPVSANKKSFTVNLDTFKKAGVASTVSEPVSTTSGDGKLFVVSGLIDPFYIKYDKPTDSITTTPIIIEVRDFDGVDDGLAVDAEPTTLSDAHKYNLQNQGWVKPYVGGTDPIVTYFNSGSKYPPNNKQWWVGKNTTNGTFDADLLQKYFAGTTPAPKGHYVIKLFEGNRATVSGIPSVLDTPISTRPTSTAFYAGRVWYAIDNDLYFSQVVDNDSKVGKCYQEYDPTSEELNEIIATDGGRIKVDDSGQILGLVAYNTYLLVLSANGVWLIKGNDGGFSATGYQRVKISEFGVISANSIVSVDGLPSYWAEAGIILLQPDNTSLGVERLPKVSNLTEETIKSFYDKIPYAAKQRCIGTYNSKEKMVYWLYNSTGDNNPQVPYSFDKVLTLKTNTQAFCPHTITNPDTNFPRIVGALTVVSTYNRLSDLLVINGNSVEYAGEPMAIGAASNDETSIKLTKFVTLIAEGENRMFTFSELTSRQFADFEGLTSIPCNYTPYFVAPINLGDNERLKESEYAIAQFLRTETSFVEDGVNFVFDYPSSCFLQFQFDFAEDVSVNRWSRAQQAYRFLRHYLVDPVTKVFNQGFKIVQTKNKLTGNGKTLKIRATGEPGKDFRMAGITLFVEGNTKV